MDLASARAENKSPSTIVEGATIIKSTPVVAMPEEGVVVEWRADGSVVAGARTRGSKKNERENKRRRRIRGKIEDILGEYWSPPADFHLHRLERELDPRSLLHTNES